MRNKLLIILSLIVLSACEKEQEVIIRPGRRWVEKTVAVVAPMGDSATKDRLERTAGWFLDNFRSAQMYDTLAVSLKLEWYDELSEDMTALSTRLSGREDIAAIIGPFDNSHVADFAPACQKAEKPLIVPTATSEEVLRRYAAKSPSGIARSAPFLWPLTETDVGFVETLMSSYATMCQYYPDKSRNVVLFSPAGLYGQTFNYWAPFFAMQYDIDLTLNATYASTSEVSAHAEGVTYDTISGAALCVVETSDDFYQVIKARRETIFRLYGMFFPSQVMDDPANEEMWQAFSDVFKTYVAFPALSREGLKALGPDKLRTMEGYEGFTPYADPTTGFELSYETKFGDKPTFAECKFYDALMLAGFVSDYLVHEGVYDNDNKAFNDAVITVTSVSEGKTLSGPAWNPTVMEIYLKAMEEGTLLHFIGASGDIRFDSETFTVASPTTYVSWQIEGGEIVHRSFFGEGGSRRIENSTAAWDYLYDSKRAGEDFDYQAAGGVSVQYPALTGQYALLVQGSTGFDNYRHLSDVLSVYQLLRKGGFDDDHIIVVADKALAHSQKNPEPGVIRAKVGGKDLLSGSDGLPPALIDYDNASVNAADIASILLGQSSASVPVVIPQDPGNDVLLYWSGHGRSSKYSGVDEFAWCTRPEGEGFSADMLRGTVSAAAFRKVLIIAEPCYAEAVVKGIEGIPGVLAITGAAGDEQSWADNWSSTAAVWLSDRFTQNVVGSLQDNPLISYRELFLKCASMTLGSHARIVNAAHFGNLYNEGPEEFITKQ